MIYSATSQTYLCIERCHSLRKQCHIRRHYRRYWRQRQYQTDLEQFEYRDELISKLVIHDGAKEYHRINYDR